MHLPQNKAPSWHLPQCPPPHSQDPKVPHLTAVEALASRNAGSAERGWRGARCHQSPTDWREQGRSKAVLVATSSLAVLSNCLRRLVGSQNSGFVSGLKKPYLAWNCCSERARRFRRPPHLPVPQEG